MPKRKIAYSKILEQWENTAYEGKYGCDWLEEVGESVKFYAMECEARGKRPTFAGLIKHLESKFQLKGDEK